MVGRVRMKHNTALKQTKAAEAKLASLRATIAETIMCRESELKVAQV